MGRRTAGGGGERRKERENIICLSRRRHSSCASAKQISSLTSFAELQRSPDKPIRREGNFSDSGVSKGTVGSGHNANNTAAAFDPLSIREVSVDKNNISNERRVRGIAQQASIKMLKQDTIAY